MRDTTMIRKLLCGAGAFGASMFAATAASAQEVTDAVADAAAAVPNPGNNAWMMTSTVLVLLMILPGLALFYGGLTRQKNMLSMLMQVSIVTVIGMMAWAFW